MMTRILIVVEAECWAHGNSIKSVFKLNDLGISIMKRFLKCFKTYGL